MDNSVVIVGQGRVEVEEGTGEVNGDRKKAVTSSIKKYFLK